METKNPGKTATLIKRLNGFAGESRLYRLSEPVEYDKPWREGDEPSNHAEFVIVSAANVMLSGPETYIFPADKDGHIICWGELEGSFRGGLDHERALSGAGYQISELSDDSGQRGAS